MLARDSVLASSSPSKCDMASSSEDPSNTVTNPLVDPESQSIVSKERRSTTSGSKENAVEELKHELLVAEDQVERSRTAILTVIGAFLVYFAQFGVLNSAGVLQAQYVDCL